MTATAGRDRPSGTTARTVAQAKVNLFLRVLAREADGYHQLETLFCRLALGDDVTVRVGVGGRSLECTGEALPAEGLGPVERNLAWRAAARYAEATGWPNDWAIGIVKRIPVGGGLGGGSADAGAVLRCLNRLAPSPVSDGELVALAEPLGADVPFLTAGDALALGWGRGERLLALPPLPDRAVTLVCFPFGVPTPDAYRWLDARASVTPRQAARVGLEALATWAGIARLAHNDFEAVVAPRYPEIERALRELRSRAAHGDDAAAIAMLAGSGSTVFAVSDMPAETMTAPHGSSARLVHTYTASRVVAVEVSD
ncbi:MAG TPA: 4-(cytidine 5'-diphospho)-2-C-methyl-D-erythritol kinase [Gemmatimonadaceae bacterium]|nr:4-(cytidine 5'-diphospho)-2-C-methyl-D-erythritol kinase [Gemmatimonadaceae bacterium]